MGAGKARIGLGRVILPLDSASPAQRQRYQAYVASRHDRTLGPQGAQRTLFAPDIIGTLDEILDTLTRDPIARRVSEFRLELPYEFPHDDYVQIVRDFACILPLIRPAPLKRTGS